MDLNTFEKFHQEVLDLIRANERNAIHASLEDIFLEAIRCAPELIVELGISKEALSAKVLSKVASLFEGYHIGVDIRSFPEASDYSKFHFVLSDDIDFSARFKDYCLTLKIPPSIDLLFIDTDELYPHVKREIECWFPYLSPECTVMFRCTNLQKTLYYKNGRTTALGWNNERGVILALTQFLGAEFDETKEWASKIGDWTIFHYPWGAGLTVMKREQTKS